MSAYTEKNIGSQIGVMSPRRDDFPIHGQYEMMKNLKFPKQKQSLHTWSYLIGYIVFFDLRRLTQYDVINLQGLELLFPFLLQSNYIGERPPVQEDWIGYSFPYWRCLCHQAHNLKTGSVLNRNKAAFNGAIHVSYWILSFKGTYTL